MGIWDGRVQALNAFSRGMADLNLSRNPLASEVIVVFNDDKLDHYLDSRPTEGVRVKKLAMVNKHNTLDYVQTLTGEFVMEGDVIPWVVNMTTTNLPRLPKVNDNIIIDNVKFAVSSVHPLNRNVDSLISLLVYPERTYYAEGLEILKTTVYQNAVEVKGIPYGYDKVLCVDVLYRGFPTHYSFDGKAWIPFRVSRLPLFLSTEYGAVRQIEGAEAETLHFFSVGSGWAHTTPLSVIMDGDEALQRHIMTQCASEAEADVVMREMGLRRDIEEREDEFSDYDGGDAFLESQMGYDGGDAWGNFFVDYDGGGSDASFITLYLKDKEGAIVSKAV